MDGINHGWGMGYRYGWIFGFILSKRLNYCYPGFQNPNACAGLRPFENE